MHPKGTSTPRSGPKGRKSIHSDPFISPLQTTEGQFEFINSNTPDTLPQDASHSENDSRDASHSEKDSSSDLDEDINSSSENSQLRERKKDRKNIITPLPYDITLQFINAKTIYIPDEEKITRSQRYIPESIPRPYNRPTKHNWVWPSRKIIVMVTITAVFICLCYCGIFGYSSDDIVDNVTMSRLESEFPLQSKDLWNYLESGVREMLNFDKPSVIILLYKQDADNTIEKFLELFSKYASCTINKCVVNPIILTSQELNEEQFIKDYGNVIEQYKLELEEKHVMIVKNFDQVSEKVAQAFHSFCDEITPLVKQSLFLFTIKVDSFEGKMLKQAENILRNKWSELEQDKLEPLLVRVSSVVLALQPETNL